MNEKILITSFQTWLPHQTSNSSDDLLLKIQKENFGAYLTFLRQLPVDIDRATQKAIAAIDLIKPDVVICCGMAESRDRLTIESNANWGNERLETSVNLKKLIAKLSQTDISHDAGKFVCEGLYYHILRHTRQTQPQIRCLFVHIPILTPNNVEGILWDFRLILQQISNF
jgi:pyroglutamyl-peptidase